ncbi:MAG: HD domain-containing protein [Myxococcaceae bacterium]
MKKTEPTKLGPRFDEALQFAVTLHRTQERKGSGVPYVAHLLGAASAVLHFGGSEDEAIAALLHDAAEDQGGRATLEEIRNRFGEHVAHIVDGCTDTFEDPKPAWRPRKEAYIARIAQEAPEVRLVSAADKLDNARAIVADLREQGTELWKRFTGGAQTLWYYRALVEAFDKAGGGPIVKELAAVVDEMERLAGSAPTT